MKKNNFFKKNSDICKIVAVLAIASILGGVRGCKNVLYPAKHDTKEKSTLVKDTVEQAVTIKNPTSDVVYHNDTISERNGTLMLHAAGEITYYYLEGSYENRMQLPLFSHENWHAHNSKIKWRSSIMKLSPLEYIKLCMHNEISANLAELNTINLEYLSSSDPKKVLAKYKNSNKYKFFIEAIEKGEINPHSEDPTEQEKMWKLMANGTYHMWMNTFTRTYFPKHLEMMNSYIKYVGLFSSNGKDYEKALNHFYTQGGINFRKYLDGDIKVNNEEVKLAELASNVAELRDGKNETTEYFKQKYPLLWEIGVEEQELVWKHIIVGSRLSNMLEDIPETELRKNPQLITEVYNDIIKTFNESPEFATIVSNMSNLPLNKIRVKTDDNLLKNTIEQIYTINNLDVSKLIDGFDIMNVPAQDKYWGIMQVPSSFAPKDKMRASRVEEALDNIRVKVKKHKNESTKIEKRRVSEDFVMKIPNLEEPIYLLKDMLIKEKFFAPIREFESVPEVLRGCDIAKKREYIKNHGEEIRNKKIGKQFLVPER